MLTRTIARTAGAASRTSFRPFARQISRRNYMVGLQPGIEEQAIAHEASTAVEMIFGYFGMMGGACAVGSLAGAIVAHHENENARRELRLEQQGEDLRDEMIRANLV